MTDRRSLMSPETLQFIMILSFWPNKKIIQENLDKLSQKKYESEDDDSYEEEEEEEEEEEKEEDEAPTGSQNGEESIQK